MSEIIQHIAPEFEVIGADAALLIETVPKLADDMRERKTGALALAHEAVQLGHSLGTALGIAQRKLEPGAFDLLLSGASIEKSEASNLIRLSKKYTLDDVRLRSDPQRQMMFALGCVPGKEEIAHEGDGVAEIARGIGSAVNSWQKFMRDVSKGRAKLNKRVVRMQTKALYDWLSEIHQEALQ